MEEPVVVFRYRCRRCDQVFAAGKTDLAEAEGLLEAAVFGRAGTSLPLLRMHRCADPTLLSMGVADLIGFEPAEVNG